MLPILLMATRLMEQPADRSSRTTAMIGFTGASLFLWHNQALGFAEQDSLVLLSATAADRYCSVDRFSGASHDHGVGEHWNGVRHDAAGAGGRVQAREADSQSAAD
jgi:hypothetical protein